MNPRTSSNFPTTEEIIAQNPGMNLQQFRQWEKKKAELEAAGIYPGGSNKAPESKSRWQQRVPFSLLGL